MISYLSISFQLMQSKFVETKKLEAKARKDYVITLNFHKNDIQLN
jgi:hypothetical protein